MSELGPEARAILLAGKGGDDPSPADRARLRRAITTAIAAGGATTTLGEAAAADAATTKLGEAASATKLASAAKTGAAISLGGMAWKGMVALIVGGAVSAGALLGPTATRMETPPAVTPLEMPATPGRTSPSDTPFGEPPSGEAPSAVDPPQMAATNEPPPPAAPTLQQAQAGNAPARRPASSAATNEPPSATADTIVAETRRLREVHGAMQNGDPEQALRLLDEGSASAEGQSLREERAAARVLALCKLGRGAEARAEAARFLSENPGSPLADRVRKACPATP